MATESAILTVLPHGYNQDRDRLRVTVFVSPRLSTDGKPSELLKEFQSFSDWPAALANLKFGLEIDGLGQVDLKPDTESLAKPDSPTWRLVFDAEAVGVIEGRDKPKDFSEFKVNTFPAAQVANQILDLYGQVAATSPTSFPALSKGPLRKFIDEVGVRWRRKDGFDKWLEGLFADEVKEVGRVSRRGRYLERSLVPPSERYFFNLLQADRFYNRPGTRDPMGPENVPDPPKPPVIDFHGYCAFLGDYPTLLRMLGLAVDLEFELPGGIPPLGRMRLVLSTPAELDFLQSEPSRPWLNYELPEDEPRFFARSRRGERQGDMYAGSLRLQDDRFELHQIDIDGSVAKAIDYASNMLRVSEEMRKGRSMTKDEASLPALRTGGFVLTRDDKAKALVGQFDQALLNQAAMDNDQPAELFAEDVIRGYRIDVENVARGEWRSLCARVGSYVVTRNGTPQPIEIGPDEGFVKGASTTSVPKEIDPLPVPELYLHETLAGWDGWSLVAKRPGQPIEDAAPPDAPPADFPLVTRFQAAPGSLPRLRFGTLYRLRARTVDLAGNSAPERTLPDEQVTEEVPFLRFDPVPSPAVLPLRQFSEGESLMRMVIRSTLGIAPPSYVELDRIKTLPGHTSPGTAYISHNDRHLTPPKTAVQLAEWHKAFDPGIGENAAQAAIDLQFATALKESGSFTDPQPGTRVINLDPADTPTDLTSHPKGEALKPGEYIVHDTADLKLPYLPDVAAAGIGFTTLPGAASTHSHLWAGTWPEFEPIRIRIVDGGETGQPQVPVDFNAGQRLLTVGLNQGEMVTVKVSSLMPPDWEGYMGVWSLLSPADQSHQRPAAAQGLLWMLTPFCELTLVHAVEKPLKPPVVDASNISRNKGETFAVLGGKILNHAKSTGRLDVEAKWSEPIDDPLKDAPEEMASQGHVADFLLDADEEACRTGRDDVPRLGGSPPVHKVRHEFGDTKHRWVRYSAVATTRFREYFPTEITDNPDLIRHAGPENLLSVPSSRRPDPPEVLYVVPTFTWSDEPASGLPLGLELTEISAELAKVIRGAPPEIRRRLELQPERAESILPEIQRFRPQLEILPRMRRTRKAGLRVYLDRPWYSSGADELLAVVVPNQAHLLAHVDVRNGLKLDAHVVLGAERLATQILDKGILGHVDQPTGSAAEQVVRMVETMERTEGLDQMVALNQAFGKFFEFQPQGDPEKFVTRWGSDPIWGSDAPATGPWIHQFPLRQTVGTDLDLSEAPGNRVAAIGHKPEFDTIRKLWYCDIDINAGGSYYPMVKLALARYQPYSIDGVHLSRVVVPEWAQLPAKRTVTVTTLMSDRVSISLRGPGGYTDFAERSLGPQSAAGPEGMAMSRFTVAHFERLSATAATDLAWLPAGEQIHLKLEMPNPHSDIRYSGTLPIPELADGQQLRLVVREYEIMEADSTQAELDEGEVQILVFQRPALRYRLVYADYIEVPR